MLSPARMVYWQVIVLIKRTFLAFFSAFFLFSAPVFAFTEPSVSAQSAVLYDPLDGSVLYQKKATEPRGMASTTKIMTALVALEQYDLQETVTVRKEWCGIEGSSIYLRAGEQLTVSDLLYGLLLESGNDAAAALAGLDSDGEQGFVQKMNEKAEALGLQHTHFENPSGLDGETHYTTALELAQIAAFAMKDPIFARIASTEQITVSGRTWTNHNRLLREIGACGVKTGFTKSCGRCLVSAKEQNGRMLLCVTLNAPNDWADHKVLYEYGFSRLQPYDLLGAGDCGSVPLISNERKVSRLYTNESFSVWLTEEQRQRMTISVCGPRFWYGATQAGQRYGTLQIRLDGQVLFETPVYFSENTREITPEPSRFSRWIDFLFRRRT